MKTLLVILAMIVGFSCTENNNPMISEYESPFGVGYYQSLEQMDAETFLMPYATDCFIKEGTLQELIWMAKGGGGHEPFQILVTDATGTLWLSPEYITGYIECEREVIGKTFSGNIVVQIIRNSTAYPININVTTIVM